MSLDSSQMSRYSRHIRLSEIGVIGQEKLCDSKILIIGLGGLGSPIALYLAAAGINTMGIAEYDTVEEHNLQRQIIHKNNRIGDKKMDSGLYKLEFFSILHQFF